VIKKKPLSEEYYKSKCIFYIAASIAWLLIAGVILVVNVITNNGLGLSPVLIAIVISTIFQVRRDALNENYALYKKDSEPIN
jgi:hypothetical protein